MKSVVVLFYNRFEQIYSGKEYEYFVTDEQYQEIYESDWEFVIVPAGRDNRPTVCYVLDLNMGCRGKASKNIIDYLPFEIPLYDDEEIIYDIQRAAGHNGLNTIEYMGVQHTISEKYIKQKENTMANLSGNMMDRFMIKVDNVVIDMTTGKMGIKNGGSIFSADLSGELPELMENIFGEMSMEFPAFAQATPLENIQKGDIVVDGNKKAKGWVLEPSKDGKYKIISTTGNVSTYTPATNNFMGGKTVMVVKDMLSSGMFGSIQSNLMPMLMMSGGADKDMEKMFQMMLLSNSGMFGGGDGNMQNMMQMMMFAKMFK